MCVLRLVGRFFSETHTRVCAQAKIQGGLSPRPLLSVPHILADESSCYYHGYVLAEMSVHQTRDYFTEKLGAIVDNEQVSCAVLTDDCCTVLPCPAVVVLLPLYPGDLTHPSTSCGEHAASLLAGAWSCCCYLATHRTGVSQTHIQGGLYSRPMLSVPHILSDESSCYCHGYVLAEMSVHQTRDHFLESLGSIVDQPQVGWGELPPSCSPTAAAPSAVHTPATSSTPPYYHCAVLLRHAVPCCVAPQVGKDLTDMYWRPGNGAMFLDLVQQLTGKPLAADAWVARLQRDTGALLAREKEQYEAAVKEGPK